jgi:hypothetical protein
MKKPIKRLLFIIAGALLACISGLVWLGLRLHEPIEMDDTVGESVANTDIAQNFWA